MGPAIGRSNYRCPLHTSLSTRSVSVCQLLPAAGATLSYASADHATPISICLPSAAVVMVLSPGRAKSHNRRHPAIPRLEQVCLPGVSAKPQKVMIQQTEVVQSEPRTSCIPSNRCLTGHQL